MISQLRGNERPMTEGSGHTLDATSLLRAAASELLPVTVHMGPDQVRFSSFVGSIREDGAGASVVLEPIAADAVPTGHDRPFNIVPAAGRADWIVTATKIGREGPTRVRVDLAHARAFATKDFEDGAVAVQATDLLVLVVPGGLGNRSSYVFPVQRIGADVCEIRSSSPLAIGHELELVEIVGDRRLLRSASAQVLESVPCYMADGSPSFSCRIALSDEVEVNADPPHDLVTEAGEVKRLLGLAGALQAQGWYEAPGWGRGTLRFIEVGPDSLAVELSTDAPAPLARRQVVRIGVEVFAIPYELDVNALSISGGLMRVSLPLILRRRRRHRREHRVVVGIPHQVALSFRHPVTGTVHTHPVREISFFGLCFECDPHANVLWKGLPLEQAQLTWSNRLVHLGDLAVEQYGYDQATGLIRCIASIPQSGVVDDPDMICLLATLAHPRVRSHDGRGFAALHRTYLEAGLFGPHMHRNLAPILDRVEDVWLRLHRDASEIARTFVHGPEGAPDAAATILRAWEHGWLLQHFVDASHEVGGATGRLQAAFLEHVVLRPDGRYLVFFVKEDNQVMNAFVRRFLGATGTPDAVTRSTVELWSRPADACAGAARPDDVAVRACTPTDEIVLARSVAQRLGPYAAAALSMVPGELDLPDTRARFAQAGLERSRDCQIVERAGVPLYAVIEERSTPGVNLTWMLNASWIFPLRPDLDDPTAGLDAALHAVVNRPPQSATGERFLNLPTGIDADVLQSWGFAKEASLYLYAMTRAGLHRFFSFSASRYGEADVAALRRSRRRRPSLRE
jgi:hypothetical protein